MHVFGGIQREGLLRGCNECLQNPCSNSVTCQNVPGSYTCVCNSGWTGQDCDIDINECLRNPCKNLSPCTNSPGSYSCACSPQWSGQNCDIDVNECLYSPCHHNGRCDNFQGATSVPVKMAGRDKTVMSILMNARPIPAVMAPGALTSTVPTCVTVPVGGPAHCVP